MGWVVFTILAYVLFAIHTTVHAVHNGVLSCHCADSEEQCHFLAGSCPSGCDITSVPGFPWSGPGCHIGNVAYKKTALQNTTLGGGKAMRAVDGLMSREVTDEQCTELTTWWSIDLGGAHVVQEIVLVTTTLDVVTADAMRVYLSDDQTFAPNELCMYKTSGDVAGRIRFRCGHTTGVHILVNEMHGHGFRIAELYVTGYEFYECDRDDQGEYYYGPGCLMSCHCESQCDFVTGVCPTSCKAGFQGNRCQPCDVDHWGPTCSQLCHCSVACDAVSGYCSGPCDLRYSGYNCQQCDEGHWGPDCDRECHCSVGCRDSDGWCEGLCDAGYKGASCDEVCDEGEWGASCLNQCHCTGRCDRVSGECEGSCADGYVGSPCAPCQPNKWGPHCAHECYCMHDAPCDQLTGRCAGGCAAGYHGDRCDQQCSPGAYGPNCRWLCDCQTGCHHTWGCNRQCACGTVGERCQFVCRDGAYGNWCGHTCNCLNPQEVCNKTSGACVSGCASGYGGASCSDKLADMSDITALVLPQASSGRQVALVFSSVTHAYVYQIQYKATGSSSSTWTSCGYVTSLLPHVLLYRSVTLPAVNATYSVRVQPYTSVWYTHQYVSLAGTTTHVTTVHTHCRQDTYGNDCQYVCTCDSDVTQCDSARRSCDRYPPEVAGSRVVVVVVCVAIAAVLLIVVVLVLVRYRKKFFKKRALQRDNTYWSIKTPQTTVRGDKNTSSANGASSEEDYTALRGELLTTTGAKLSGSSSCLYLHSDAAPDQQEHLYQNVGDLHQNPTSAPPPPPPPPPQHPKLIYCLSDDASTISFENKT